jgi:2-polyprenyl-6-methoxyphenol hydroxylase-like FAD-dependent oxidoreductase
MEKQRICIVGEGLAGLMSVIALNKLPNLEVHLITKKNGRLKDKRTTAISPSNFNFFQDIMSEIDKKLFWPSKKINLFYETNDEKINFLNFNE